LLAGAVLTTSVFVASVLVVDAVSAPEPPPPHAQSSTLEAIDVPHASHNDFCILFPLLIIDGTQFAVARMPCGVLSVVYFISQFCNFCGRWRSSNRFPNRLL
jgi:uncharacterized membrane protein AbrB (regulator of aidB expression)